MADTDPGLPDEEVHDRIGRLDDLLEQIEQAGGPVAEIALRAVTALAEVYGTALARVLAVAEQALVPALLRDELLHHLFALHGIHPQPAAERVRRALDDLRPQLRARGYDAEWAGTVEGVARVRVSGGGCGSAAVERVIADAVLAAAPELRDVEATRAPATIPVESLLRGPTAPGGTA